MEAKTIDINMHTVVVPDSHFNSSRTNIFNQTSKIDEIS